MKAALSAFLVSLVFSSNIFASENHVREMPKAYAKIADAYGIPADIFFAIALQESGKKSNNKYLPWPWALNVDGNAMYFNTRQEAEHALLTALRESKIKRLQNIDVGIVQINMAAHAHNFESPMQALDPTLNLNYGAQYLATQYVATIAAGRADWWEAVGRYHNPSNKLLAEKYRAQVYRKCLRFSDRCSEYGRAGERLQQESEKDERG